MSDRHRLVWLVHTLTGYKDSKKDLYIFVFIGARGETRTLTSFRKTDFKSVASTNSATRAGLLAFDLEARDGIESDPRRQ